MNESNPLLREIDQMEEENYYQRKLLNRWVAVHPELTTDPLRKQCEIGKIAVVSDQEPDVVIVRFADGKTGRYCIDGLLTLYPKEVIVQGLQSNEFEARDREVILSVLKHCGNKEEEALKLAPSNDTTRFFCLTDYKSWLDMKTQQSKNQRKTRRQ